MVLTVPDSSAGENKKLVEDLENKYLSWKA